MGNKCGNGFALSWLQPAMGVTLVGLAAIAGCQGSPSSSPASSTGNFRFGQQTQQAIDQFKNQAQGTAQAGNTALQSGAQDLQKSVSSQMASLDAQRQQLTLQAQSSTGQAKQQGGGGQAGGGGGGTAAAPGAQGKTQGHDTEGRGGVNGYVQRGKGN